MAIDQYKVSSNKISNTFGAAAKVMGQSQHRCGRPHCSRAATTQLSKPPLTLLALLYLSRKKVLILIHNPYQDIDLILFIYIYIIYIALILESWDLSWMSRSTKLVACHIFESHMSASAADDGMDQACLRHVPGVECLLIHLTWIKWYIILVFFQGTPYVSLGGCRGAGSKATMCQDGNSEDVTGRCNKGIPLELTHVGSPFVELISQIGEMSFFLKSPSKKCVNPR